MVENDTRNAPALLDEGAVAPGPMRSGATYIDAADDDRWDREIRGFMDEAIELVGTDVGVPILVFGDGHHRTALFGPVVSPAPSGDEALALWDGAWWRWRGRPASTS